MAAAGFIHDMIKTMNDAVYYAAALAHMAAVCSTYLGDEERDDEVDELEVVGRSFLFLLFVDFLVVELELLRVSVLGVCLSLALPPPLLPLLPTSPTLFPLEKLELFDLPVLIFILRLGDSGCCRSDEKLSTSMGCS